MIISEAIARLEELKALHGDKQVFFIKGCGCCNHAEHLDAEKITHDGEPFTMKAEFTYQQDTLVSGGGVFIGEIE